MQHVQIRRRKPCWCFPTLLTYQQYMPLQVVSVLCPTRVFSSKFLYSDILVIFLFGFESVIILVLYYLASHSNFIFNKKLT